MPETLSKTASRTVFFGPFVGEFGWEVTRWHGWVRKTIQTDFKDARTIVSSTAGRQIFYPEATEFWPIPKNLTSPLPSHRNYITDAWIGKFPRLRKFIYLGPYFHFPVSGRPPVENVRQRAMAWLEECASKLPEDTQFFVPWKENHHRGLSFGVRLLADPPTRDQDLLTLPIPYSQQEFAKLEASPEALQFVQSKLKPNTGLVCIFPRMRSSRRPDKNWKVERYVETISLLQKNLGVQVALLGSPGGCYFENEMPPGTVDFIHVPESSRADIHAAAVAASQLCLGSISGAMVFALLCGGRVISWSAPELQHFLYLENLIQSPLLCYPEQNPSVETIYSLCEKMLNSADPSALGETYRLSEKQRKEATYAMSRLRKIRRAFSPV